VEERRAWERPPYSRPDQELAGLHGVRGAADLSRGTSGAEVSLLRRSDVGKRVLIKLIEDIVTEKDYQGERKRIKSFNCAKRWNDLIEAYKADSNHQINWKELGEKFYLPAGAAWHVVKRCKRLGLL
jgi:hypothetical protein